MTSSVFLGTPLAAVPALRVLAETTDVAAAVTRPDRPRGRSGRPRPSPVAAEAGALGIDVLKPRGGADLLQELRRLDSLDVGVVVAFGMLLKPDVLAVPRRGFVNVHFSLLPAHRGAAPVERAILAGDAVTGVTLIVLDEGLDTGPMLARREVAIGGEESAGELTDRLALVGAQLLGEVLPGYVAGGVTPKPQPEEGAVYAAKVDPAEARLSASVSADRLLLAVRAFNPRPGVSLESASGRLKVWRARRSALRGVATGELAWDADRLLLGVKDGVVELLEVQPAGGRRMSGAAWARGRRGTFDRFR